MLAASLAYGNVRQIRRSIASALERMSEVSPEGPATFVDGLSQAAFRRKAGRAFQGFVHRFNRGEDVVLLLHLLSRSWKSHGTLGAHFGSLMEPSDSHIGPALDRLVREWKSWAGKDSSGSFGFLVPRPEDGSCCKRWCMFLRWMGRRDEIDPGLWSSIVSPRQLIIPLDTHTGRISQYLGLTERRTLDWKAALEVTDSLRLLDPNDPTKYDFALSRLGILDLCQKTHRVEICSQCELKPVCRFSRSLTRK